MTSPVISSSAELPEHPKSTLPDFETVKVIGTGTFGKVTVVAHKINRHIYALKSMRKTDIVKLKQVEHVANEKNILKASKHPFIVRMYASFQDETTLHLLMEYVPGGELFARLRKSGRFAPEAARFYGAQVLLALAYLHSYNIVYRDLKPENILIDPQGYVRLCDFGFAKRIEDKTFTLCGTPEYLAPEVIHSKGYGRQVDWWSLGVLLFEIWPPFYDDNPFGIYEKIVAGKVNYPSNLDEKGKDLIKKLLVVDKTKRLGCLKNGVNDIKEHKYFQDFSWDALVAKRITPPWVPTLLSLNDTSNFGELDPDDAAFALDPRRDNQNVQVDQRLFSGF